jgi:threonine/homoserine/homoserine lactone efflux protein
MIDQTTLIAYLAILLGFVFIPGPAVLLTLTRASTSGTSVGIATGLGIAIGDLLHTAMVVFGLSAVILNSALVFSLIKYAGAAYLVYLGIRSFLEKPISEAGLSSNRITAFQAMRQAVLAELLNPKSALFFLAFLPQFVRPENGAVTLQLIVLGILFVGMGLLSTIIVSISAGPLGAYLQRNPAIFRWQGKFIGGIYCALGLKIALQER